MRAPPDSLRLDINPAALVDLPPGRRPRPLVWTAERTRAWQHDFETRLAAARASGKRVDPVAVYVAPPRPSPVMVWTPAQTAEFLRHARDHFTGAGRTRNAPPLVAGGPGRGSSSPPRPASRCTRRS